MCGRTCSPIDARSRSSRINPEMARCVVGFISAGRRRQLGLISE
jgi:hypothetical protein